jgi:acyl carrier protein
MERKEVHATLLEIMGNIKGATYRLEDITEETYLSGDMGVDSIEMLEALHDLQKRFDIKIPESEMVDIYTICDVVNLVMHNIPSVKA